MLFSKLTEPYESDVTLSEMPKKGKHPRKVTGVFRPIVSGIQKVQRNGPCPCGSGKKFKKCCLGINQK